MFISLIYSLRGRGFFRGEEVDRELTPGRGVGNRAEGVTQHHSGVEKRGVGGF